MNSSTWGLSASRSTRGRCASTRPEPTGLAGTGLLRPGRPSQAFPREAANGWPSARNAPRLDARSKPHIGPSPRQAGQVAGRFRNPGHPRRSGASGPGQARDDDRPGSIPAKRGGRVRRQMRFGDRRPSPLRRGNVQDYESSVGCKTDPRPAGASPTDTPSPCNRHVKRLGAKRQNRRSRPTCCRARLPPSSKQLGLAMPMPRRVAPKDALGHFGPPLQRRAAQVCASASEIVQHLLLAAPLAAGEEVQAHCVLPRQGGTWNVIARTPIRWAMQTPSERVQSAMQQFHCATGDQQWVGKLKNGHSMPWRNEA